MKDRKYVMCSGLAFSDKEDMEMLHKYAKEGWVFREFRKMRYVLYKEEPQNLIFSYDMQKVKKEERDDYLTYFEEAGWSLIPQWDSTIHFFSALEGTQELHTDHGTRDMQYRLGMQGGLTILLLGIIMLILSYFFSDLRIVLIAIGAGCLGGGIMCTLGCYYRTKGICLPLNARSTSFQIFKIGFAVLAVLIRILSNQRMHAIIYMDAIAFIICLCFLMSGIRGLLRIKKERLLNE